MEHIRYNSIQNYYKEEYISRLDKNEEWVVLEKVHGANFQFITDGVSVLRAKRNHIIVEGEEFFGHQLLDEKYERAIIQIFNETECKVLRVFGELFGGRYADNEETFQTGGGAVQYEVDYHNEIDLYVFDILADDTWLSHDKVIRLSRENGLFPAESMFRGPLRECLDFDQVFITTIPNHYGHPPIFNNYAEGVVMKPSREYTGIRPSIKKKGPLWYDGEPTTDNNFFDTREEITETALECVNENRFLSCRSKLGEFDKKRFAEFLEEMTSDVMLDIACPVTHVKYVRDSVRKRVVALLREKL